MIKAKTHIHLWGFLAWTAWERGPKPWKLRIWSFFELRAFFVEQRRSWCHEGRYLGPRDLLDELDKYRWRVKRVELKDDKLEKWPSRNSFLDSGYWFDSTELTECGFSVTRNFNFWSKGAEGEVERRLRLRSVCAFVIGDAPPSP